MKNLKVEVSESGKAVNLKFTDSVQETFIVLEKVACVQLSKVAGFYTINAYMVGDSEYTFSIGVKEDYAEADAYELYELLKGLIDKCLMTS